jgi:hypothetical protein
MTEKTKIIYCFTSANLKGSSVQDKVIAQINALNEEGAHCTGLFFSTAIDCETRLNEHIVFVPVPKAKGRFFRTSAQQALTIKTMHQRLLQAAPDVDFIYLRYPGASRTLFRFAQYYGDKLVSEHQSKEVVEIMESAGEHPFGLRPSKLLSWLQFLIIPVFNEKTWGVLFARRVKAIVTVTYELAAYQKAKGCRNVAVVANGIDVSSFHVRTIPELHKEISLLFLKGTSTLASWNGLDRIINSIDKFHSLSNSPFRFKLLICGKQFPNEFPERDYIEHLGYLRGAQLEEVFNRAHIAASTMCSYRRGLEESAILKTREYFARGIPFIYAYKDVDFDGSSAVKNNTLHFSNDDSLMEMERIVQFARNRMEHPEHAMEMNLWAKEHLDYSIKMSFYKN